MHSPPQITQSRDRFPTEHPNGRERVDNSYTVLAAMCSITVLSGVPQACTAVSGILSHKSTEKGMHASQMAFNSVCIRCMHIWTTGTWDRIVYLSCGHVICILLKRLMGRHSSLGTNAQLSSHDASWHYALSVCHTEWRWVLPVSIPTQHLLEMHLDILGTWYNPHFGIY